MRLLVVMQNRLTTEFLLLLLLMTSLIVGDKLLHWLLAGKCDELVTWLRNDNMFHRLLLLRWLSGQLLHWLIHQMLYLWITRMRHQLFVT